MVNPNLAFSTALAAALADLGLEHACVSPGSRNTPLIAAFAAEPRIRKWPVIDERSSGFFGIGLARATGKPVALICTSGTAAAEFHPAVVEASQSEVPLLVLTADRPPELRNVGAPQTIDQVSLYGSSPRLFIDVATPQETKLPDAMGLADQAWAAATHRIPGPVHVNLPFREPLLDRAPIPRSDPAVAPPAAVTTALDLAELARRVSGKKGLIVAGRSNDAEFPVACSALAEATGFPVFADPLSGLRYGAHSLELVLEHGDAIAAAGVLDRQRPDLVLRFGPVPTSKPVWTWLAANPQVEQVLANTSGQDAVASATTVLTETPTDVAIALARANPAPSPASWPEMWRGYDATAASAVNAALDQARFPNEPAIARTVAAAIPPEARLTVGSSMPIRDLDTFGGKSKTAIRVFGNRGANGIDGVASAALGTAASGRPAVALLGDVSLLHDLNALATAVQLDLRITIVVVNNDGGGIFHFLPQNDPQIMDPGTFEDLLATPHGTDFVTIAHALGMEAADVFDAAELSLMISAPSPGPLLIQLRTDRTQNLELHRQIASRVQEALSFD